mgnify:CR=1 FL=1
MSQTEVASVPAEAAAPNQADPARRVVLEKPLGGKWSLTIQGVVTQRDINHLTRVLRIEFNKAKHRARKEIRKAARQKEYVNGNE